MHLFRIVRFFRLFRSLLAMASSGCLLLKARASLPVVGTR